jgi:hypothetical protein
MRAAMVVQDRSSHPLGPKFAALEFRYPGSQICELFQNRVLPNGIFKGGLKPHPPSHIYMRLRVKRDRSLSGLKLPASLR